MATDNNIYTIVLKSSGSDNIGHTHNNGVLVYSGVGFHCMFLVVLITGCAVHEEDLKQFGQWNSRTPGHPENFETPGVEVTTGPLGQGIADALGLALAEAHLAACFNKTDAKIVDHYTYSCISNEAASLAGHWGLGKLIALYDVNHISIDGNTAIAFTIDNITTTIGFGSPNKANSNSVHRAALGSKLLPPARTWIGLMNHSLSPVSHWSKHIKEGAALKSERDESLVAYEKKYPTEAAEFKQLISLELPEGSDKALPVSLHLWSVSVKGAGALHLRSQAMPYITCPTHLNALARTLPGLIGGHADLALSNMTLMKMFGDFQKNTPAEQNVSETGVIYIMTHDSIGVGEDVPTHQPIEHLASFRAMPNMVMFRPADGNETSGAYKVAVLNHKRPSTLALSRQKLPNLPGTSIDSVALGAYIISDNSSDSKPDLILLSTGSELEIAFKTAEIIWKETKTV
ncbi:hypothetical protein CY35_10G094900 [Sphagnum magellanicum]|nr:hypothetical protein CY35_10G094900 [Sphagnum magellanicum]